MILEHLVVFESKEVLQKIMGKKLQTGCFYVTTVQLSINDILLSQCRPYSIFTICSSKMVLCKIVQEHPVCNLL